MDTPEQVKDSAASPAAPGATPPSPEAKPAAAADSAPAENTEPTTVAEALEKVTVEKVGEKSDKPESGAAPEKVEAKKEEPAATDEKADSSLDVPFASRPEWKSLAETLSPEDWKKARPVVRELMKRETQLNERITSIKPLADITTELQAQCGGEAGFAGTRKLIKAFEQSPADSVPMLETLLADARKRAGLEISSPDLLEQKKLIDQQLADGNIEAADAERQRKLLIEAEKGRASGKRASDVAKTEADQRTQAERAAAMEQKITTLNAWEENARKTTPDFGKLTEMDDPKHGDSVADQVFDAIALKWQSNPNLTGAQILAEAERVLKQAKGRLQTTLRTSKPVISEGSNLTAKPAPKTLREALDNVPAERTA